MYIYMYKEQLFVYSRLSHRRRLFVWRSEIKPANLKIKSFAYPFYPNILNYPYINTLTYTLTHYYSVTSVTVPSR